MTSSPEILCALRDFNIPMSRSEIDAAWDLLRQRANAIELAATMHFAPKQRVFFEHRHKNGRTERIEGEVVKVNQKTVMVASNGGMRWKVSATLLHPIGTA